MRYFLFIILFSCQVFAKLSKLDAFVALPNLDIVKELEKDALNTSKGQPLRYAVTTKINNIFIHAGLSKGGQWNQLADGSWVWRVLINSDNAKSLGFGLYDFYMPPTAELKFYDWTGSLAKGPYNDQKNKPHKQLWTGPIIGDVVTVELSVANKYKDYVSFTMSDISRGYKSIWQDVDLLSKSNQLKFWEVENKSNNKSGSCNVDVACSIGDDWQDQINSVARYTFQVGGSIFTCTGQLLNNTENNGRPLFLTANHCGVNSNVAASINIWLNYESSQCRDIGSTTSGTPISIENFNDTQSGSSFLASYTPSDMTLLELDERPKSSYEVFLSGWDRRDLASNSATTIHHPNFHAKRISVENNPTTITGEGIDSSGDKTHIRVADWDMGTTELGSSGAGLWNSNKLLIGQLHSGAAACGNDLPDWYGRLFISWEGGGTPNTSLKDWLDPNNNNVQTLQGIEGCTMSVSINHSSSKEEIGVPQNFSLTVQNGIAPYSYKWDINADEKIDGTDEIITATYAQRYVSNVSVEIQDSEGCIGEGSIAVVIESPEIVLQNTGSITKSCGNNNSFIDPGERWRIPVTLQNNGIADATNSYAVFEKKATGGNTEISTVDDFGNAVGSCNRNFIDISNTGLELGFVDPNPNDNFPAQDEGSAIVDLPAPFDFYGQTINRIALSSNGYISVDSSDTGVDFDNDCPLPSLPNNTQNGSSTMARIIPLHDDLITQHLYHQHFTTCPRQSSLGTNLACDIFMYQDVDVFDNSNNIVEHFNFEAILYPAVNQWVYQYDGIGFRPESSSVGIQNNNATDGISYSCNNANRINTTEAVCVYHKDFQDNVNNDVTFYNLETPIISTGDLQASQNHNSFVEFSVAEDASCGSTINIAMQAAVYQDGFNQDGTSVISATLGDNETCQVVTNCSASDENTISSDPGLWHNNYRSGNGYDMYSLKNTNGEINRLVFLQYTAETDSSPIWYITGANGYMQNNQAFNEVTKVTYNGPFLNSTRTDTTIGSSLTTFIDADHAIQTRTINGKFSADLINPLDFGGAPSEQRTGLWFNPAESGWGQSIGTKNDNEVILNYIYDNQGQPYWLLGNGANAAVENIDMLYYNTFCPHCPKTSVTNKNVGSIRINYGSSNTSATMENLQVNVIGEHETQWNRTNMPITLLTPRVENITAKHIKFFGFTLIDTFWDDPSDLETKDNYSDEVYTFSNIADILVISPSDNIISRLNAMHDLQMKSMLHLTEIFFEIVGTSDGQSGVNYDLRVDYQARWNEFVSVNQLASKQDLIQTFYIGEEPTWNSISYADLKAATDFVKASFPDIPIMLIEAYPAISQLQIPSSVDWIGFDHYSVKDPKNNAEYLAEIDLLKSLINDTQNIVMIMDTHYRNSLHGNIGGIEPTEMGAIALSYFELAQQEPKIIAIIGYFWPSGFDDSESIGARNMSGSIKNEYSRIGKIITGKD